MNDELLMMIYDVRRHIARSGPTVNMATVIDTAENVLWRVAIPDLLRDAIYAYADVERVEDWLPVGTPKDWVLGELDRLAEFVTGDDT
jgi:hypothetical protein